MQKPGDRTAIPEWILAVVLDDENISIWSGHQNLKSAGVSRLMLRVTVTPRNPDAFHLFKTLFEPDPGSVLVFTQYFVAGSRRWDVEMTEKLLYRYTRIAGDILDRIYKNQYRKIHDFPFSDFL